MSNPKHEATKKQTSNGKVLNFRKNARSLLEYFWTDIDAALLRDAIHSVTRAGGAIMLGRTSDGGAFSILVLHNNDKAKEYPHSIDECNDVLKAIIAEFDADWDAR